MYQNGNTMSDVWKSTGCDFDICMYGTFCNPCLFGENSSHVVAYPSCFAQAAAVTFLYYSFNITGAILDSTCFYGNTLVSTLLSTSFGCLSCIMTGMYSSDTRTKLRERYNIEGSELEDLILHCLCHPCTVCREAQEIRHRTNNRSILDPIVAPGYEKMEF